MSVDYTFIMTDVVVLYDVLENCLTRRATTLLDNTRSVECTICQTKVCQYATRCLLILVASSLIAASANGDAACSVSRIRMAERL